MDGLFLYYKETTLKDFITYWVHT